MLDDSWRCWLLGVGTGEGADEDSKCFTLQLFRYEDGLDMGAVASCHLSRRSALQFASARPRRATNS